MSDLAGAHPEETWRELDVLPRGRHNLPREQVRAAQRQRMLRGMVEAVTEKGYARTSVADVIARARASRETFYEHFQNKQDCFMAAYEEAVTRLSAIMLAEMSREVPPGLRFERALEAYLETLASQPALAHTFLIEVYAAGPDAWRRRAEVLERFGDVVFELLGDDPHLAVLPDPRFAVRALVGAISSMVTGLVAAGDHAALPALRAPIVELLAAASGRARTPAG